MKDAVVRGRPEAALAITPPLDRSIERGAREHALRRGGVVRGLIAICVAGALYALDRWIPSAIALTLGGLTLTLALASPGHAYLLLNRSVDRLGDAIGTLLTWVLLAPVFYLFITPFGLLGRRGARDRIGRRFDRGAATYWTRRPTKEDAERRASLERPY